MTSESTIPTPATPDVCTLAILIEGKEISGEFHVLSLVVGHEVNRIPYAKITLQDGEASKATFPASNSDNFIPGKKIEIQVGYRSQNEKIFSGIIIKHSIKIRKSGSQLTLECRDLAVKMTTDKKCHYFTDSKDSAIMESLISAYGLDKSVEATQPDIKDIVQYDSSDWDFLICRAEANGQVVSVDTGKVSIAKPTTGNQPVLELRYGSTILELDAEIDARSQSKDIKATSWSPTDQKLTTVDAKEPSVSTPGNIAPSDLAKVIDGKFNEVRHGGRLQEPELQAWADARLVRERLAKVRGRVRFQGFAKVLPTQAIKITGIGERFEGAMFVSGVMHSVANGNWETDVQFGLSTTTHAEHYHLNSLPVGGLMPAVNGLQIGIVTALENDPDGEDRIKVKLPLIKPDEEGIWARLMTLDAGKERGTYFRPEISDEVLVGFLNDDPRHAVVLGMLHSSAHPAPVPAKDDNHIKGYVSREKMKMTFDDEKKIITFETPAGNKMAISEDAKGFELQDQNGNKIIMNDSGISIESIKDFIVKVQKDLTIKAVNVECKAQTGLKLEGSATVDISAASASLKGSASTVIKGGIVQIN